ncbi:DUF4199 family protein [Muricauda sp. JGD-17]|uniref:DUF4199 family protein n=1 Tax=Flagellimonas ochracea TaxID=2696472 RepID=A0A964TF08_9FLAO|nr:DUF4199 family protein [Allomuricauda ochracea]
MSIATIIYFLLTNLLGVSGTEWAGWLGYTPYLIVIFIGQKNLDKVYQTSYKSRFFFGALISLLAAMVSSLFMYVYLTYIDDLMVRTVVENAINTLDKEDANYTQLVVKIKEGITPLFYLKFGTLAGIVVGILVSAATAIFTRKIVKN